MTLPSPTTKSSRRRRPPVRQRSLVDKMRASLKRSLSGRKLQRTSAVQDVQEMNVFANEDLVTKEFVLKQLEEVRNDFRVVKLEIEDSLCSSLQESLLPIIHRLLVADKRKWQFLKFIDSLPLADFEWWQGQRKSTMESFERSPELDHVSHKKVVKFQANVDVPEGTSVVKVLGVLKKLDNAVYRVTFSGALFGCPKSRIPHILSKYIDKNGNLHNAIVINVVCGWTSYPKEESSFLARCIRELELHIKLDDESNPADLDDTSASSASRSSFSSFPSSVILTSPVKRSRSSKKLRDRAIAMTAAPKDLFVDEDKNGPDFNWELGKPTGTDCLPMQPLRQTQSDSCTTRGSSGITVPAGENKFSRTSRKCRSLVTFAQMQSTLVKALEAVADDENNSFVDEESSLSSVEFFTTLSRESKRAPPRRTMSEYLPKATKSTATRSSKSKPVPERVRRSVRKVES